MAEKSNMEVDNNIPPPYTATESALPTTYSTSNVPPRAYSQTPVKVVVDRVFLVSLDSILLISEGILSLVAFICAASDDWFAAAGGGWIIFVGLSTFVCQVILFVMYLFRYIYNMPSNVPVPLVELVYFAAASLFFFISGIVAATKWHWSPSVRACTVFCWFAMVAYVVDTYRRFVNWRNLNESGGPATISSNVAHQDMPPPITTEPTY